MTLSTRSALSLLLVAALPVVGCSDPGPEDVAVASSDTELVGATPVSTDGDGADCAMGKRHGRMKGPVTLADAPEWLRDKLAGADTDGDGIVSVEEGRAAREARKKEFEAQADADEDGVVSDTERQAAFRAKAERRFAEADTNGDQSLTREEIGDHKWAWISRADANQDGKVAKGEIETAFQNGTLKFKKRHFKAWKGAAEQAAPETTTL